LVLTFVKVPTAIAYECQNRDTSGKPSRLAVPVPLHEPYASLKSALHPLQRRARQCGCSEVRIIAAAGSLCGLL